MSNWFKHQTSMRGRLSILLILLMVLPMVAMGWLGFRSITGPGTDDGSNARMDLISNGAGLRIDKAVEQFDRSLDASVEDLASRLERLRATDATSIRLAFGDLPPEQRPSTITEMDAQGVTDPLLGAAAVELLRPFVREGYSRFGYVALPAQQDTAEAGSELLYQVAIQARPGGLAYIALRPLHGEVGAKLLSGLLHATTKSRALTLRNAPVQARVTDLKSQVGRTTPDTILEDDGVSEAFWRDAISENGRDDVHQIRIGETVIGGIVLRDLGGAPIGLALVQATDNDLLPLLVPLLKRQGDLIGQTRALIGWIALLGVMLAIGMGVIAPRWVWRDIRASTDIIFNSVERLRELVRRNSRALGEQSETIKSLLDSMIVLDKASSSIAGTSRVMAHSAEQSAWVSQSGNQNVETAQRGVLEVRDRVVALSDQMQVLERRCAAIGSILGFIDHLSNETNDLSINATIQAAGAGTSGRQFSAVASEIGKLAEQARKSTHDIQQLIEQIQETSRTTLDATQEGGREVDRCLESFEELESAFARILRWVEQTTQSARGIEQSTAQQAESLQVVAHSIESLEQRARETVGNYHAVVEAADELAALGAEMNETWRVG